MSYSCIINWAMFLSIKGIAKHCNNFSTIHSNNDKLIYKIIDISKKFLIAQFICQLLKDY